MEKVEFEGIGHEGRKFYTIGCKKCRKGQNWKIYSDGSTFLAECECGHKTELKKEVLQKKPEPKSIPLHLLS